MEREKKGDFCGGDGEKRYLVSREVSHQAIKPLLTISVNYIYFLNCFFSFSLSVSLSLSPSASLHPRSALSLLTFLLLHQSISSSIIRNGHNFLFSKHANRYGLLLIGSFHKRLWYTYLICRFWCLGCCWYVAATCATTLLLVSLTFFVYGTFYLFALQLHFQWNEDFKVDGHFCMKNVM